MTVVAIRSIVLAAMMILGKSERVSPSPDLADAIAQAVMSPFPTAKDGERYLTGSPEGDAVLATLWAWHESRFRACVDGDGGKSFGPFQLQRVPRDVACAPADAARIWLALAHDSARRCSREEPDERLAALASGSCTRGRGLARWRVRQAREIAIQVARGAE